MYQAKIMLNGELKTGSESFDVFNPATGKVIGTAPNCSIFDLYAAVTSADEAFKSWSKKSEASSPLSTIVADG
jgi:acyl-CoA reductase-like NAD-dependent aldehyde dehydrogenase